MPTFMPETRALLDEENKQLAVNVKQQQMHEYAASKDRTRKAIASLTDAELEAFLELTALGPKEIRKFADPQLLAQLVEWGVLNEEQSSHTSTKKIISSITDAGLGGVTLPITTVRLSLALFKLTLVGTSFYITAAVTSMFSLIFGPIAFYSVYRASKKMEEDAILNLQLANDRQMFYEELNLRQEEAYIEDCLKVLKQLEKLAQASYLKDATKAAIHAELAYVGMYSSLNDLFISKRRPGWLKSLKEKTFSNDQMERQRAQQQYFALQTLQSFFADEENYKHLCRLLSLSYPNKPFKKVDKIAAHADPAVGIGPSPYLDSLINALAKSKDTSAKAAKKKTGWQKLLKTITKNRYTVPLLTGAGVMFTCIGIGYLGGGSFVTGLPVLTPLVPFFTGPVGTAIAIVAAASLAVYFGVKYYQRMKETKALNKEVAHQQKIVNTIAQDYSEKQNNRQALHLFSEHVSLQQKISEEKHTYEREAEKITNQLKDTMGQTQQENERLKLQLRQLQQQHEAAQQRIAQLENQQQRLPGSGSGAQDLLAPKIKPVKAEVIQEAKKVDPEQNLRRRNSKISTNETSPFGFDPVFAGASDFGTQNFLSSMEETVKKVSSRNSADFPLPSEKVESMDQGSEKQNVQEIHSPQNSNRVVNP